MARIKRIITRNLGLGFLSAIQHSGGVPALFCVGISNRREIPRFARNDDAGRVAGVGKEKGGLDDRPFSVCFQRFGILLIVAVAAGENEWQDASAFLADGVEFGGVDTERADDGGADL
jgi:hypothetical protein